MSVDTAFTRMLLAAILPEVRKADPTVKVSDAWVYKLARDHWEFHFNEFYWHGGANNAFEARFNGWEAWLRKFAPEDEDWDKAIKKAADRYEGKP